MTISLDFSLNYFLDYVALVSDTVYQTLFVASLDLAVEKSVDLHIPALKTLLKCVLQN